MHVSPRTSCFRAARNFIVVRSQMQALPSVAPVTATPGPVLLAPVRSTNATASMLSPSVCPPKVETTSPLLRLTTRTPPSAPPTTASVDEGLIPIDVMPSRLKRASSGESLNKGVGDRGSQNNRMPSEHALNILFPIQSGQLEVEINRAMQKLTVWCECTALNSTSVSCKYLHGISRWHCTIHELS